MPTARRRFILHITSRSPREAKLSLLVSSYTDSKLRTFDLRVVPRYPLIKFIYGTNNEDATNRLALYDTRNKICIRIILKFYVSNAIVFLNLFFPPLLSYLFYISTVAKIIIKLKYIIHTIFAKEIICIS